MKRLSKEAGRKVIPAANGCNIHDMGDCFIVTNKNGLNIGQCRTMIEAEDIAENADEYTARKLGYAESRKIVKEGAAAGYTVTLKNIKLQNAKVTEDEDGDFKFEAEIVPDEYEISAHHYYGQFCPMDEYSEEYAPIEGTVYGVCWWAKNKENVEYIINGHHLDISFNYGAGWLHVNLPEDGHIVSDDLDLNGHDSWEIQTIELNSPQLSYVVNDCYEHYLDEDEPEEEVDESRYMSDDDIAGQYKDWWFSEFGPVEDNGDKLDASAWIEFPSADGEDFDYGRGLWFRKSVDSDRIVELNDVWMEYETEREVKNAARLLMDAKVKYLSFDSAEEFHKYMDEFKKGSMVNEVSGWSLEDDDLTLVNSEDDGDKLYIVKLWWGSGYQLDCYNAYAFSEEEALNYVVAYLEKESPELLKATDEYAQENEDSFIYVDATMEGANEPHYVWAENLAIAEYPKKHNHPMARGIDKKKFAESRRDVYTLDVNYLDEDGEPQTIEAMKYAKTYYSFEDALNAAKEAYLEYSKAFDEPVEVYVMGGEYETDGGDIYGEPVFLEVVSADTIDSL